MFIIVLLVGCVCFLKFICKYCVLVVRYQLLKCPIVKWFYDMPALH